MSRRKWMNSVTPMIASSGRIGTGTAPWLGSRTRRGSVSRMVRCRVCSSQPPAAKTLQSELETHDGAAWERPADLGEPCGCEHGQRARE